MVMVIAPLRKKSDVKHDRESAANELGPKS